MVTWWPEDSEQANKTSFRESNCKLYCTDIYIYTQIYIIVFHVKPLQLFSGAPAASPIAT